MKIKVSEEFKFNFFIFMITAILATIVTMELVHYSGYDQADSALVKKIESLANLLQESHAHNEQLSKEVLKLEKELFELKHGISRKGKSLNVQELYALAGLSSIKGNGLVITIFEQIPTKKQPKDYANILQSDDLLRLVNVLKSAGASAISVNNERLIITSEITNADNCIVINKNKIEPPYVIKVIGDYDTISSALLIRGGIAEYLALFGIEIDIQKAEALEVLAY